jgi:rSAM/selenodomain-associated transferase 1
LITKVCVLLFVKYPVKGIVKVRLTSHIEPEMVVELYRNFVLDLLSMLTQSGISFLVVYDPEDSLQRFERWLGTNYEYIPQIGCNLGERLKHGFVEAFSREFQCVLALASDIPDLPVDVLLKACEALETEDVVIGPSPDGGYYLIGFQRTTFLSKTFEGITWSSDKVLNETISQLKMAGRSVRFLPLWSDVDTYEDLQALIRRGTKTDFCSSNTMKYLLKNKELLLK